MSLPLRFSRAAKRDIDLAFVWYEKQKPGLGDELLEAVEECLKRVADGPEMFAIVRLDLRVALVRRFPYLVVFRIRPDRIRISAVVHASRHPRHWKDEG
jgi:plasmid stabilization system protein ParE